MVFFFSFVFLSTISPGTQAFIRFSDAVQPELATSARALAMGNAFICKVDDSSAVFYNPAGLGTVRYPHIHLSNFHFEINKGFINAAGGGKFSEVMSDLPKSFDPADFRDVMVKSPGTISNARVHVLPNFTSRFFTAGYLYSRRMLAVFARDDQRLYEVSDRTDHGPYAAFNFRLFGGVIKFGVSAIWLNRKELIGEVEEDFPIQTDLTDEDYNNGSAIIVTEGFRLTLPFTWLPTFAAVVHNGLGTSFTKQGTGVGEPAKIPSSMDLGVSITPQLGQVLRLHFEVNIKDFTTEFASVAATRKLLMGMEIDFARMMFIRFGYGDGFGSGGIGIRTKKLEFDLTSYAVDTSPNEFRGTEDRRFAISISSGF